VARVLYIGLLAACTPAGPAGPPDATSTTPPDASANVPSGATGDSATPSAAGPRIVDGPTVAPPDDSDVLGLAVVQVTTDVPTSLAVELVDPCGERTVAWPGEATVHEVELVGLHLGSEHHLTVVLTDAEGRVTRQALPAMTVPTDPDLPALEVLAHTPEALGDDLLVVAPRSWGQQGWVVAYDGALHPVYALPREVEDLRWHEGAWWALYEGRGVRWDARGRELGPSFEAGFLSHELYPLPDGGALSLEHQRVQEPAYPVDTEGSDTVDAELLTQAVLRFDASGKVVDRVSVADVLDTTHVGYESVQGSEPLDWSHANAVIPYDDDTWLVSVRHLDVLAAIGHDGALKWLLGDPAGWRSPWQEAFLEPVGELTWFRHAHAPHLGPDGTLWLFDNGNHGGSPYAPAPEGHVEVSRAVGYRLDLDAGTVEQAWEVHHDDIFSAAMGDADPHGDDGEQVLITFSAEASLPLRSRLVVRGRLDDQVALDVRFIGGTHYTYRAQVVDGLVAEGVVDTRP